MKSFTHSVFYMLFFIPMRLLSLVGTNMDLTEAITVC